LDSEGFGEKRRIGVSNIRVDALLKKKWERQRAGKKRVNLYAGADKKRYEKKYTE